MKLKIQTLCTSAATLILHSCSPAPAYATAPLTLKYTSETSTAQPYRTTIWQGETVDLQATLKIYGAAVTLPSNAVAALWYQTNGMANAWWQGTATATTGGVLTAHWTPALDVGAASYTFYIGVTDSATQTLYRSHGQIKMMRSPGFSPNSINLPVRLLDFNAVSVTNAPWATPADVAEATDGMLTVESDPVAAPHIASTANPHGVTAAQVGALPVDSPATGTVFRALQTPVLVEDGGASSVSMVASTATVHRVSHDWTRLIVVSGPGEEWAGPPSYPAVGTVFVLSTKWAQSFPDYAPYYESEDGVWAISGMVGLDSYWHWANIAVQPGWEEGSNHTWWLGQLYTPGEVSATIDGYPDFVVSPTLSTNSVPIVTQDVLGGYATTNWVESIRGIHADIATNVVYHVVVSNGHWLIQEVQ